MILLFSGGIDSYIAYHYLNFPDTLYFNLNTPYSDKEEKVVKSLIPRTIVDGCLSLKLRQDGENAYVPFRNLYLCMLATMYSDNIVIAGVKGDNVSDKNPEIFGEFSRILSRMENRPINVWSPFWTYTKDDIVKWYLSNGKNRKDLLRTVSCYSEKDTTYCGKCPSCFRKWNALYNNGINIAFDDHELMLSYLRNAKEGKYIEERNASIIKAISAYFG